MPNESLVLYFRDFVENRLLPDFETIAKGILKTLEEKVAKQEHLAYFLSLTPLLVLLDNNISSILRLEQINLL